MARPKPRPKTVNVTRTQLMRDTAERFLDIGVENGANAAFYYERLEVMTSMQLVDSFELVVYDRAKEPIGGVTLIFDWDTHTAMVESNGEFVASDILNVYGTTDSISDTLAAVQRYVSGLRASEAGSCVSIWYTFNDARVRELGEERYNQLLDRQTPTASEDSDRIARWNKVTRARSTHSGQRQSTFGDLPEASIKAWKK